MGNNHARDDEKRYLLSGRAFAYDGLKCVFLQAPTMPFLKFFIEAEVFQAFPFHDCDADLSQALNRMLDYLKQTDVTSTHVLEHLRGDYTRLFLGPDAGQAPPWESMYRGGEPFYFSKQSLKVRAAYGKYQLVSRRFGQEPDDHIGLELDFMHKLCELAKAAMAGPEQTGLMAILADQKAFLEDHLLQWVPAWSADVSKMAEAGFYEAATGLLNAYLKYDSQLLEVFLSA